MADSIVASCADAQIKSKQRVSDHGEVFTNPREVNAMLDLVKDETLRLDSRFLEPACGTGNFLIEILRRKLEVCGQRLRSGEGCQRGYELDAVLAVSSLYGIELLPDNAETCRQRLLALFEEQYRSLFGPAAKGECIESVRFLLSRNIIQGDTLTYRRTDCPGSPIMISEWNLTDGDKLIRKDRPFQDLVEYGSAESQQTLEFSDTFHPVHYLALREEAYEQTQP